MREQRRRHARVADEPAVRTAVGQTEHRARVRHHLSDRLVIGVDVRRERGKQQRGAVALESLSQLTPGDYVVHIDHSVGCFRGLERITIGGQEIEGLAIEYADGEILRVPVNRLDLVERWVGEARRRGWGAPPST